MNRYVVLRALILALLIIGLTRCHRREAPQASAFPRKETLYVGGLMWGEPTTFNPLTPIPSWPVNDGNLIYETVFVFDALSGKMVPSIGESCEITDEYVEVTLNAAARWNDGQPLTARDIKYNFDLGKRFKGLRSGPLWTYITEIVLPEEGHLAPGQQPRRLRFMLNQQEKNPLLVLDQLVERYIVPEHVFEPLLASLNFNIEALLKLKFDKNPVGSGPYRLHSYSSEKVVAIRDDNYWGNAALHQGKLPAPKYVIHPIYKSNDHFSVALQQGRIDISTAYMPRIWLKRKKGVRSWFEEEPFFLPACIPMMFLNTQHAPLNDVRVRRAMAFAVNYDDIRELAVSGYSPKIKSGLILPFGLESKYFSEEDAQKYGASRYDPEAARALLREGGYQPIFNEKGELVETRDAQGKKLPTLFIKSPTGWSDWESIVRIAVRGMRAVGIDVRERFVDAAIFWQSKYVGDFDLIMDSPMPQPYPSKPWTRFENVLTTRSYAPLGQKMFKNYGRFNNPSGSDYEPRVDELLKLIPTLKDQAAIAAAYRELNVLFMKLQPTLPMVYRGDQLYQFSTRVWQGFPTAKDPYLPPQLPGYKLGTRILWHLRPAVP
ncbi:MAG TPA: ABC transporter substrate-binding protein [Polyangiaceae bacterium]|nr:ABC transporter substrate-binding protein [Polyangiaceae bacterium]